MKRKLIEVALPLEAINRESTSEKWSRQGHPSSFHLWWARRPLAACRAVIFAALVDDPSSDVERFPTEEAQQAERQRLFRLIESLVKWENTDNEALLELAREEIARSCGGEIPTILDPFCGGGSIPLEAQRLGTGVVASDLNPVAVLITKALIDIPTSWADKGPSHPETVAALTTWKGAQGLAEDVRYYGRWVSEEAERQIGSLYPRTSAEEGTGHEAATAIAWIWARTLVCPNPACGATMPLLNSFSLSSRRNRSVWLQPVPDRSRGVVSFDIRTGDGAPPKGGSVGRTGAVCLTCETVVPLSVVREFGRSVGMGSQLLCTVAEGRRGRVYVQPTQQDEDAAAVQRPADVPVTELPAAALGFRVQAYGITHHADLFTNRQLVALTTFCDVVRRVPNQVVADGGDVDYAAAVGTYLGLTVGRLANRSSRQCFWDAGGEKVQQVFARNALPMIWVFAEANPFSGSSGNFIGQVEYLADALERVPARGKPSVSQLDAAATVEGPRGVVITDPPYYDNVPYADLSDFFYVWLRRCLGTTYPELFSTILVPKAQELIAEPARQGSLKAASAFFESGLRKAFRNMLAVQDDSFPLAIFYAFKQSEDATDGAGRVSTGWETMLQGLIDAGASITGTWPIRTEQAGGLREVGRAALASSIVLVCRPRASQAPLATRRDFLTALKSELPDALRTLQQGSIAPVDLAQAAIGPGMAVFSRYVKVVEADGSAMTVRTALGLINQVLDETLAEQESDFDAETRWALAWFEQYSMNSGPFGVAETLSKAKNTAVNGLVEAGVLESRAGKVRLLDRAEMSKSWDPALDTRLTVWEVTQHLIRAHEQSGEAAAAELLRRVGGLGETARELAYRLYVVCERKKWAKEALAYNSLVVAWPEIVRLAGASADSPSQGAML